jgi:hypothetical protein
MSQAVTLLIALLVASTAGAIPDGEPSAFSEADAGAPADVSAADTVADAGPAPRKWVNPAPEPEPEPAFRVEAGGGAEVGVGIAPGATLGARAQVGLRFELLSVSLEAHGGYAAPAHLVPVTRSASGPFIYGLLAVCLHPGDVSLCALGGGGITRSFVSGFSQPFATTLPLALAGARAAYDIPLGDVLRVRASLDVYARLTEVRLKADTTPVWTSGLVAGSFGLSLWRRF